MPWSATRACSILPAGQLALAPNLPGWGRQGLVDAIREQLGADVSFENDVNLAALGESWRGAGVGVPTSSSCRSAPASALGS